MERNILAELITAKAADIVIAYLATRTIEPDELAPLVSRVYDALKRQRVEGATAPNVAKDEAAVGASEPALAHREPKPTDEPVDDERPTHALVPPIPIDETINREFIICLEDGKRYRSLRRHLKAKYNMTPDDYRRKWNLPADYPMVAPSYAEERSQVAKRIGLGNRGVRANAQAAAERQAKRPRGA